MKKNVNQWFFFNPLFILFRDSEWFIEALKDPDPIRKEYYYYDPCQGVELDPFDYDERQMDGRESYEIKSQMVNHQSASGLRKLFRENENFEEMLNPLGYFEDEKIPLALITFVLSLFIATDVELRQRFYDSSNGKIPAITQFCLNTFRLGPISDEERISGFRFIDDEYRATIFCCGLGNTLFNKDDLKLDFESTILAWFRLLDQHFNSDQKPYLEWVDFERVPRVSTDKNYLGGLSVEDEAVTCSAGCYFHELTDEKKDTYTMLARVVDSFVVPENTELLIPHKNLLERDFDEREMTAKLVRFIVYECKRFLPPVF